MNAQSPPMVAETPTTTQPPNNSRFNPCAATVCIYHDGEGMCTLPPSAVSIGAKGECTAMETEDEATEGEGDTPQTLPVRPAPPTPPAPVNNTEDTPVGGGGMNTSSTMPRTIPPANTGKSVNRKKNQKRVPRVR